MFCRSLLQASEALEMLRSRWDAIELGEARRVFTAKEGPKP